MQRRMTWVRLAVLLALVTYAIAYAQNDSIIWQYRYAGPSDSDDQPLASFVDDTGNVCVVGWTTGSSTGMDVLLFKLDSLGRQVWLRTFDYGRAVDDVATDAIRDASGNIYVGAGVADSITGRVCLLKYSPDGNLIWTRSYAESGHDYAAAGMARDSEQCVYIAGVTESTTYPTVRVLKYSPNGELVSNRSYTAGNYKHIWAVRYHILPNGGVYLALGAEHPERGNDWLIVKLSPAGAVQWQKNYKDTDSTFEGLRWSAVDEKANICITGVVAPGGSGTIDFCTMMLDSLGNSLWTREYNGPAGLRDEPQYLLLDEGCTYVAGWSIYREQGAEQEIVLVKYDSFGNQLWTARYGSADTTCTLGYEALEGSPDFCPVSRDDFRNSYLTGRVSHRAVDAAAIVVKIDSLGNRTWVRKLSAQGETWSGAVVGLSQPGRLYSVGSAAVISATGHNDMYVVKYLGR